MRHEELAEAILLSPALQRLHTVFRQDRLPIVPSEAVAQRERVLHAVRRHGGPIDHLRFDLKVLVRAEERVVHKIAVVARDVGGRPDRIEDFQIGLRHEAEGLPAFWAWTDGAPSVMAAAAAAPRTTCRRLMRSILEFLLPAPTEAHAAKLPV